MTDNRMILVEAWSIMHAFYRAADPEMQIVLDEHVSSLHAKKVKPETRQTALEEIYKIMFPEHPLPKKEHPGLPEDCLTGNCNCPMH